jgi:hypothetical protein
MEKHVMRVLDYALLHVNLIYKKYTRMTLVAGVCTFDLLSIFTGSLRPKAAYNSSVTPHTLVA